MKKNNLFILSFLIVLTTACQKESSSSGTPVGTGEVFICNEGNFGWGNGDISRYKEETGEIENNFFRNTNSFLPGDVVQSMTEDSQFYYIVVNNSAKILAVHRSDFTYSHTFSLPGSSPRHMLVLPGHKAYVSDLYANRIWILDLESRTVTGFIPVGGWSEEMVCIQNKVYVAVRTKPGGLPVKEIAIIDPGADQTESSIILPGAPVSLCKQDETTLWILTEQSTNPAQSPHLIAYSRQSQSVIKDTLISGVGNTQKIACFQDRLFLLAGSLYLYENSQLKLWIPSDSRNFYSLGVNPSNGNIYVSDAKDYLQESRVYHYTLAGNEIRQFEAGIISGFFYFPGR